LSSMLLVCLLVSFTDVAELTSVLTVSAVALFVCYFNFALSHPSKPDNNYTKLYDYVITFYREIELVWFSSWNHINFLFLLVRYIPFALIYPVLSSLSFWAHLAFCSWFWALVFYSRTAFGYSFGNLSRDVACDHRWVINEFFSSYE
jgi:hypothetical protein